MDGCGISNWHPDWLQKFAKTSWFIVAYSLLGTIMSASGTYFVITLTTIEKRFKIPSQTTGTILSGNEISQILLSLILSYFGGQKNIPKWLSWGVFCMALSYFILASPHLIYGAGEEALQYTQEYSTWNQTLSSEISLNPNPSKNNKICQNATILDEYSNDEFSYVPLILIFLSQFVIGIGNTLKFSLGPTYLDNNTKQRDTALMLSYVNAMQTFGPIFGFSFAYIMLKIYISPMLTPVIRNDDQRWMGAWWLGCIMLGVLLLVFAAIIALFPRNIKKNTTFDSLELNKEKYDENSEPKRKNQENKNGGLKDIPKAMWRLLTNKLLMVRFLSNTFASLAYSASVFNGRKMEVQFNKTSAGGNAFTGTMNTFAIAISILLSGLVIKKYQPSSNILFFWNFIVGLIAVCCTFSYTQLGCDNNYDYNHSLLMNQSIVSCNSNCICDGIKYSPVCDESTSTTYFSPCHAGCKTFNEKQKYYTDCSCTSGEMQVEHHVSSGACSADCNFDYYAYTFISMSSNFIRLTASMSGALIVFRAVEQQDKALAQGLAIFMISLFGLIPGPIIFGRIIDSTCLIWNHKNGRQGNCLLYDSVKFRYYIHSAAAIFLTVKVGFDFMIWYYGKNLNLYGDSSDSKEKTTENQKDDSFEIEPLNLQQ